MQHEEEGPDAGWMLPCLIDSLAAAKAYADLSAEINGTEPVAYEVSPVPDPAKLFKDTYHNEVMPGRGWEYDGEIPAAGLRRIEDAELQAVPAEEHPMPVASGVIYGEGY